MSDVDDQQGRFVWYELATGDVDAAQAFYAKVAGWTIADSGMPGVHYLIANVGARGVAGLMHFPPDAPAGSAPAWYGYVAVDDVDAVAERAVAAGGTQHRAPMDIPGVGRFAVMADPTGAMFMLFRGEGSPPADLPADAPGSIGWHELRTTDWPAAFAFYESLFGWTKSVAHDMGPMGVYQTFEIGGESAGGMMNATFAPPHWAFYVVVDDIDAAADRVREAGGSVTAGPHEVPGGTWVVMATDPQGGHLELMARQRVRAS